jgi:hypothetical protein
MWRKANLLSQIQTEYIRCGSKLRICMFVLLHILILTGLTPRIQGWHGASTVNNGGHFISDYAVDGEVDNAHRWASSTTSSLHWLLIDLQDEYSLQTVLLYAGFDWDDDNCNTMGLTQGTCTGGTAPSDGVCGYVFYSWSGGATDITTLANNERSGTDADSQHWHLITTVPRTNEDGLTESHSSFEPVNARFVRFRFDQSSCTTDNSVRIFELEILGSPATGADAIRPPGHSLNCQANGVDQSLDSIMTACCTGQDCTRGPPKKCTQACADVFSEFWEGPCKLCEADACPEFATFYEMCEEVSKKDRDPVPIVDITRGTLDPGSGYSCSFAEIVPLAIACSDFDDPSEIQQAAVDAMISGSSAAFCKSSCFESVAPFMAACSGDLSPSMATMVPSILPLLTSCGPEDELPPVMPQQTNSARVARGCSMLAQRGGYVQNIQRQCKIQSDRAPVSCSDSCADVLSPFYHECGAALWGSTSPLPDPNMGRSMQLLVDLCDFAAPTVAPPARGGH